MPSAPTPPPLTLRVSEYFWIFVNYFSNFYVMTIDSSPRSGPGVEGTGLPIRDCARSCNNRKHTQTQLSATDVTGKAFFKRLYLALGLSPFEARVNCPYSPTLSLFVRQLFLDFRAIFLHTIHQVIWKSPGTLLTSPALRNWDVTADNKSQKGGFSLYETNVRFLRSKPYFLDLRNET